MKIIHNFRKKKLEELMESLREFYKIGNGPSSSHTMGPEKAAKEFKKIMCSNGNVGNKCCILCK